MCPDEWQKLKVGYGDLHDCADDLLGQVETSVYRVLGQLMKLIK
jgi:hypothetical protein